MERKGSKGGGGSPKKKQSPSPSTSPTKKMQEERKKEEVKVEERPIDVEEEDEDTVVVREEDTKNQGGGGGENQQGEAEGAAGGLESWTGWFSNTISKATEKSNEMFQYLKQDISEFTETVSEAGKDLKDKLKLEESATQAFSAVGDKVNVVLEQMSTIFGVGVHPDDEDEEPVIVGNSSRLVVDRVQAKIYSLAMEESVFLKDPEEKDMAEYEEWLEHFDLEKKHDEIVELLTANPHLQLHYSQLVPEKVSHLVFWHRFYFQVKRIMDEEAKHVREREATSSNSPNQDSGKQSPLSDHGGDPIVELSEEDQKRLLAEYEEELKKSGDESGKHSRRSSDDSRAHMSSSSSGSFAFVTRDPETDEVKVE